MQLSCLMNSLFDKYSTCKLLSNVVFLNKQQLRAILVYLFICKCYATAKSATIAPVLFTYPKVLKRCSMSLVILSVWRPRRDVKDLILTFL